MTDSRTRLELALLLFAVSVFIFFTPFVLGSKQPAIKASVKQNMDFLLEMVNKYKENHKQPPVTMEQLINEARDKRYNKTLFNPIFKNSGDAIDRQIVVVYDQDLYNSLGPNFHGRQYAGKTGFYSDGVKFAIYGHLSGGDLMRDDKGQVLVLSNN